MRVNQNDEPVVETELFCRHWSSDETSEEVRVVIAMLLEHFNLKCVRTNATKHGNVELKLEERHD